MLFLSPMTQLYSQWGYDMSGIILAFVGGSYGGAAVAAASGTLSGGSFMEAGFAG
jgi:hypothetical protein